MVISSLQKYGSVGLLVLRLAIGAIFIYHGMLKWNIEEPNTTMAILKFLEPIAGAVLIIGVFTQIAALLLGIVMLGAIYMKMTGFGQGALDFAGTFAPQGGTGWEFDLMIFAGCVALFLMGAGSWSVDGMMKKKV